MGRVYEKLKKTKFMMFLCTLMIVAPIFMQLQPNMIGSLARNVEEDTRKSQRIPDSWEVVPSYNDELYALLFYNPYNKDEYKYSLYVNKKEPSFGYIFRGGGDLSGISNPAIKYIYGNKGCVLVSLNEQRIQKIERDNGERDLMEVDVDKPIVAVFPLNSGIVKL